ncbi:hypothetical protein D6C94_10737 [Aureobasidium pullulans]|uniref:Tc1-like transposase DDE domain-containing protein n=1 Tax=Aureobasidium pullulans TaxID=5580 RepID=A0AB38LGP7_AURPU|nr:hypothetical protein D6C94_10737 [Aureobasidium pullulans]
MVSNWPTCVYKVRAIVKNIHRYVPRATLVVKGAVTQAMYEHWLETVVLPQSEPYLGRRSIIIMDNCSTHHSDKITELCGQFGVQLLYLPPYLPHLNPIEQTFHLLKHWLRKHRDLAPRVDEFDELEAYKAAWIEHLEKATA